MTVHTLHAKHLFGAGEKKYEYKPQKPLNLMGVVSGSDHDMLAQQSKRKAAV